MIRLHAFCFREKEIEVTSQKNRMSVLIPEYHYYLYCDIS